VTLDDLFYPVTFNKLFEV